MYWPYYFNEELHISFWQKFTFSLWKSGTPPLSGYNQREVKSGWQHSRMIVLHLWRRETDLFFDDIFICSLRFQPPDPLLLLLDLFFVRFLLFCQPADDKNRKGGGSYSQAVTPVLFHQTKNLNPRPPRHGEATMKKTAGCDGHLSQTRPSILILPNESPTEGTWWDHLPQDGKIHTSITSSQHITPPHCCCFTQHWHPRGHQLWITCGNAIYSIEGMKHTIISLKNYLKCHYKYCCSAEIK